MSDHYTEQDLRRFLATAEERAEHWRAQTTRLLTKLSRITDAAYENEPAHTRHVIEQQTADLHEGWYVEEHGGES